MRAWNLYEKLWLVSFIAIAAGITIVTEDTIFGFSVFLSGVLCVIFAAKGHLYTYLFGIYNTFAYAYLAYNNGLFGELGLYLLFYTPMNFIGFFMWKRKLADKTTVVMRGLNNKAKVIILVVCAVTTWLLYQGLALIPTQNQPFVDALTNVLSVIATILMVQRFKEQWLMYIILNIAMIALWGLRLADGSSDAPIMLVMWSAFLINAFYGYYTWTKGASQGENQ